MYKIKRFSVLRLLEEYFSSVSKARSKVSDNEPICLAHIELFMGNMNGDENDTHRSDEIIKFVLNSCKRFSKIYNKFKSEGMFPEFLKNKHVSSEVTNKLRSEFKSNGSRLVNLVKSSEFRNIVFDICDSIDLWVKENKRVPSGDIKSDKDEMYDILKSVRDNYYPYLAQYKRW
jgi:endogenous inhibitor of DNA gyrase (YacG/DUF329 family)